MPASPWDSSILAAIRAGVLAFRRRLYVVIYSIRPTRRWCVPASDRAAQADPARDPGVLLEGYLVSELDPAERELFGSWLLADRHRELTVAALRRPNGDDAAAPGDDEPDVVDWWLECQKQIRTPGGEQAAEMVGLPVTGYPLRLVSRAAPTQTRWYLSPVWAGLAASILCVSLALWALRTGHVSATASTPPAEHSYATARGERAVITLDGATVVLGPESVLRISGSYGVHDRTVSLTGHAYFDIRHDATHPFRVWAGGVLTEDIGTRFDIRAYTPDSLMQLVVAEGAVEVHARDGMPHAAPGHAAPPPAILVTRGMMASAGADGVVRVRTGLATDRYLSWSDGRLAFDDTPLPEVVAELNRWYDLDIRLGEPRLASRRLTASFDDPPSAVLVALESALGVRATRVGRVVTLYPP